jgi:hypothetical protein
MASEPPVLSGTKRPSAGQYMAINLINGRQTLQPQEVVPMKGYRGLGVPNHVLGLSGPPISLLIPYHAS